MLQDNLPRFDELNEIKTRFESEIYGSMTDKRFNRKRCEDIIFDLLTMAYVYGLEVAGLDLQEDIPVNREKMERLMMSPTAGKTFIERLNDYVKAANDVVKAAESGKSATSPALTPEKSADSAIKSAEEAVAQSATATEGEQPTGTTDITPQIVKAAESLVNDLSRLAETETHRVLNEAILDSALDYAKKNPEKTVMKTWVTMADDRVREPHEWLEGSTVPVDAYFYTDGDRALAPGGFESAALNCGCRCILRISK